MFIIIWNFLFYIGKDVVDILLIKCRIFLVKMFKWNVGMVVFSIEMNDSKVGFENW